MGKYVLVAFDKDAQAEAFITKMQAATEAGKPFGLAGVFQKPDAWCECGSIPHTKLSKELVRGKRLGLKIHRACRKPRKTAQDPINLLGGEYIFRGVKVRFSLGEDGKILRNFPLHISKEE